jgi:geranylgeranylglycerol-phosphate geranylgeranyltransferase
VGDVSKLLRQYDAAAAVPAGRAAGRVILGALRLTRPHNCLGGAAAVALGAYLAGGIAALASAECRRAMLIVALGIAVGNIANDWRDAGLDAVAKPHRPIPMGDISAREALIFGGLICLAIVLLAASLGTAPLVFALLAVPLGIVYSFALKNTVLWGNATVGLVSASPLFFASVVAGTGSIAVWIAFGLVFLFVFAREILKTIADELADRKAGLHTVATQWGTTRAFRAFYATSAVFLIATLAAVPWAGNPMGYFIAMMVLVVVPMAVVLVLLGRRGGEALVQRSLRITKVLWFSGLFAMILLR